MKYFPILQELFESDTIVFLIVGIIIVALICLWLKNLMSLKKCTMGMIVSIIIYVLCELISNIHINFLSEIILLFIGTFAIGCGIGFLVCTFIELLKVSQETET